MATKTIVFMIVGDQDIPLFEEDFSSRKIEDSRAYLQQFILHASLDVVDQEVRCFFLQRRRVYVCCVRLCTRTVF